MSCVSSLSISLHRSYDDGKMRLLSIATALVCLAIPALAIGDGQESFETRCALCHGGDASGTDRAASIIPMLQTSATDRLSTIITEGVASRGMPAIDMPADELGPLVRYLKQLAAAAGPSAQDPREPRTRTG